MGKGIAEAARQKARRALRTARLSVEDGDADAAVNRAYYAAFHVASAALELAGEHPKTHKGVHNLGLPEVEAEEAGQVESGAHPV